MKATQVYGGLEFMTELEEKYWGLFPNYSHNTVAAMIHMAR